MGAKKLAFIIIILGTFLPNCVFAEFIDNHDGTITDTDSNLIWQQTNDGQVRTWQEAMAFGESLELADYHGWRLPTLDELRKLVDTQYWPTIDPIFVKEYVISNTLSFWTSTPATQGNFYNINFSSGKVSSINENQAFHARYVRDISADLAIAKVDGINSGPMGDDVEYTITVTNNGPDEAGNVKLLNTLPAEANFVSATPSQGSCSETAGVIICDLSLMGDGDSVDIVIAITTPNGKIAQKVSVASNISDTFPDNNSVSDVTRDNPQIPKPEPPLAEAGGPYIGQAGSAITFDAGGSFDPDGEIVSYEWDFDNNGTWDILVTKQTITNVYDTEYVGLVTLRVTDDEGLTSMADAQVEVKAADLEFPDLSAHCKSLYCSDFGRRISLQLFMENSGNLNADAFTVTMYLSSDGIQLEEILDEQIISKGLRVNRSRINLFQFYSQEPLSGKYIICVVDSGKNTADLNRDNNMLKILIP